MLEDLKIAAIMNIQQLIETLNHLGEQETIEAKTGTSIGKSIRNLNQVDVLTASTALRQLRDFELLLAKNKGSATYYIPGNKLLESLTKTYSQKSKEQVLEPKEQVLEPKEQVLEIEKLPQNIETILNSLGKKANNESIEHAIKALCGWKEMTSDQIATYLQRDQARIVRLFLSPMVERGLLNYKYPAMPKHPDQTYTLKKPIGRRKR